MVWPWPVIRSTSRNAWVNQIAAVRLISTNRNAPKVVRKIYRPIDPIRLRRPTFGQPASHIGPHVRWTP